jgi:DNA-binding CsgD family transcriptional regulator
VAVSVRHKGVIGRRRRLKSPIRAAGLTPRERDVARLVERNLTDDQIARALDIKPGTVKIHVRHILVKIDARGRRKPKMDAGR